MKKLIYLFLFFSIFFSQAQNSNLVQVMDSPVITNFCFYNVKKAFDDFKNNQSTYYLSLNNREKIISRSYEKFVELMLTKNIKVHKILWKNESIKENELLKKEENCYEETMNFLIKDKYGNDFISKIFKKADSLYIIENKDKIFDYYDFDTIVRYSKSKIYDKQNEDINKDIKHLLQYPKKYKHNKKEEKSYSSINFIIYKTGKIDIESISTVMKSQENEKYTEYFEKQLIDFVKKSKWNPISVYGITISSKMSIYFSYD